MGALALPKSKAVHVTPSLNSYHVSVRYSAMRRCDTIKAAMMFTFVPSSNMSVMTEAAHVRPYAALGKT